MALSDKDLQLKFRTAALFRKQGYVVFHEVELNAYSYQQKYSRKQITDFDVLGVRVDVDYQDAVAVAECKSTEEGAMENLLKLSGVSHFFGAHKSYFVQKRIDDNAREVGKELGIWCLDEHNIASMLSSAGIGPQMIENEAKLYEVKAKARDAYKAEFAAQAGYLRTDYWMLPAHRNVINLLHLIQQLAGKVAVGNAHHALLVHQLAIGLCYAIMRICGLIVRHNIDQVTEGLLTSILGGSRERRDREVLFDEIAKLVPDARLTVKPPFFESLAELVNRFVQAMDSSHLVLACMDAMCSRLALGVNVPDGAYNDRTIKLARDIFRFTATYTGIDKAIFEPFLTGKAKE
ncbi:MAG: hypothetical protein WD894_04520 [Pirellulales bacterium]